DGRDAEQKVRGDLGRFYLVDAQRNNNQGVAYKAAQQLYEAVMIVWKDGTAFQKAHLLDDLGQTENFMHKYGEAESNFKDAVYFRRQDPGFKGTWLAGTLMRQGSNFVDEKKYDLALQPMREAIAVEQKAGDNYWLAEYIWTLANTEAAMGNNEQAVKHYDQAIQVIDSSTGKTDARLHDIFDNKADALEKLGKKQEAAALRAQNK
ncbi:MAG: hypothetical protein ACRD3W_01270, partial [Terriglobales bacterium]